MSFIDDLLRAAAAIEAVYFELPIVGRLRPILRERVYCYELYHQLRSLPHPAPHLTLTAEPDKRGHPDHGRYGPNPDLILHWPGTNTDNDTVVEVECWPTLRHLRKDFSNFACFRSRGYRHLVLLIYGVAEVPWTRLEKVARETSTDLKTIELLHHPSVEGGPSLILQP